MGFRNYRKKLHALARDRGEDAAITAANATATAREFFGLR
jgi:hypothetical protein